MLEKIRVLRGKNCLHQAWWEGVAVQWDASLVTELGDALPVLGVNLQRQREPCLGQLIYRRQRLFESDVHPDYAQ